MKGPTLILISSLLFVGCRNPLQAPPRKKPPLPLQCFDIVETKPSESNLSRQIIHALPENTEHGVEFVGRGEWGINARGGKQPFTVAYKPEKLGIKTQHEVNSFPVNFALNHALLDGKPLAETIQVIVTDANNNTCTASKPIDILPVIPAAQTLAPTVSEVAPVAVVRRPLAEIIAAEKDPTFVGPPQELAGH